MGCGGSKQTATVEQTKKTPQQQKQHANDKNAVSAKPSPSMQPSNASTTKADNTRDKYVVSDSGSNGTNPAQSESTFSEASDKGFKRKLREKLKQATAGSDIDELEKAMDRFTRHKLDDCGDYSRAQDRLHFLKLRRDLRDAVRRSHVGVLKKTIEEAESSQFSGQLQNQIETARKKLQHLQELNEYKHDILNMEQSTISEIHSYQRPPVCVHDVMVATYLMLGHPEQYLTEWSDIQSLLCRVGRDSLIHEIRDFDSAHVDESTNRRVQDILRPHELHTIRQASNGAATFYVWTTQISEKVERDQSEGRHQPSQEDATLTARTPEENQGTDHNTTSTSSSPRKKQKG